MSIYFNADEIFQIAERIERNGANFYRRAAMGSTEPARLLFLNLAAREEEHEKIFAGMRSRLSEEERKGTGLDLTGRGAYLQAWADGHVFDARVNPVERLTGKETLEDIYQLAIGMEKDSMVFYLGMKDVVPAKWGRSKINRIIQEEMSHISALTREIETIRHQIL